MPLTFEEDGHLYRLDGTIIPSVSAILEAGGIHTTLYYDEAARTLGAQRGTALHRATEFLEEGTLDWGSVDPVVLPYLRGYEKFLVKESWATTHMEHRMYCPSLGGVAYAGTADRLGRLNGAAGILDLKTAARYERWMAIQTAGYALADHDADGTVYANRWRCQRACVMLTPDGDYDLRIAKDPDDLMVFTSAAVVARWRVEGQRK